MEEIRRNQRELKNHYDMEIAKSLYLWINERSDAYEVPGEVTDRAFLLLLRYFESFMEPPELTPTLLLACFSLSAKMIEGNVGKYFYLSELAQMGDGDYINPKWIKESELRIISALDGALRVDTPASVLDLILTNLELLIDIGDLKTTSEMSLSTYENEVFFELLLQGKVEVIAAAAAAHAAAHDETVVSHIADLCSIPKQELMVWVEKLK